MYINTPIFDKQNCEVNGQSQLFTNVLQFRQPNYGLEFAMCQSLQHKILSVGVSPQPLSFAMGQSPRTKKLSHITFNYISLYLAILKHINILVQAQHQINDPTYHLTTTKNYPNLFLELSWTSIECLWTSMECLWTSHKPKPL